MLFYVALFNICVIFLRSSIAPPPPSPYLLPKAQRRRCRRALRMARQLFANAQGRREAVLMLLGDVMCECSRNVHGAHAEVQLEENMMLI